MAKKDEDPEQSKKWRMSGESRQLNLLPIEEVLAQQGYPPQVVENYPRITRKDLQLAELYRTGSRDLQAEPDKKKIINPVQARIDRKGQLWVDVLIRKKEGVKLSEIKKIMKVHGKPGRGQYISGRIKSENLPELAEKSIQLQTARPLFPALYKSLPSIKADKTSLSTLPLSAAPTGSGVIIGIVDIEGCDFKHPSFINNNGTRLLYLWDQRELGGNRGPKPQNYKYGVEFTRDKINTVLNPALSTDPYDALKYTPADKAHGTHVMDIAAGSSSANPGIAPGADLIFVHIGKPINPNNEELKTMGSSKYLLDAVQYIFEKAGGRPVVINISLAGNGGSHDGTSPIESAFDEMLKSPGRAIVIAAGNSHEEKLHIEGTVEPNAPPYEIKWLIEDNQKIAWDLRQELEIWYGPNDRLKAEVIDPTGKTYGECQLEETQSTLLAGNPTPLVLIRHLKPDAIPGEEENLINILIDNDHPDTPIGTWIVKLSLDFPQPASNKKVDFQAWIEYSDESHSHFAASTKSTTTLNTIGNGILPIVVGSYDPRPDTFTISKFSSAGPSRNKKNNQKPELCAPGEFILAARATTEGSTLKAGTSMSAPHVTGLIALMFQAAKERSNNPKTLNMREITDILIRTSDPNPTTGGVHQYDPQYGFGHVNALNALLEILN